MPGLAKQRVEFGLGDREAGGFEDLVHVDILPLERHSQLFQHHVVRHPRLYRPREQAVVLAALEKHQPVEKMCQRQIGVRFISYTFLLRRKIQSLSTWYERLFKASRADGDFPERALREK